MSSTVRNQHYKLLVDDLIRAQIRSVPTQCRAPLWQLIHAVRSASDLLSFRQARGSAKSYPVVELLDALVRMARHCDHWVRLPEGWMAAAGNPAVQLRSLVSHLFDCYPVPKFMARVWLSSARPWEIDLYLHLAEGRSIRQFELRGASTISLSKKAAAWFMQAPDDLEPLAAMRWAQIRSLNGDDALARKLSTSTVLKAPTDHELFWETVIRFLVANQPIELEEAVSIVTFVHQQKFVPARSVLKQLAWSPGTGEGPLQPAFTLRGRTLRSLRRHMTHWLEDVGAKIQLPEIRARHGWSASGISPMILQLDEELWTIEELLNRDSLRIEGGIMKHCVASYVHACHHHRSSIWSMKIHRAGRRQRTLTIEVSPTSRRIVQAKGVRNSAPSQLAAQVLEVWARREDLRLG